jgi:predicted RNase H-like nuclease
MTGDVGGDASDRGRPRAGPVAGADGCKAGWVVVTVDDAGAPDGDRPYPPLTVVPALDELVADVASGRLAALAVDMPIGLSSREPRACDQQARRMLGPRRASVFPAPVRAVLGARTYAEALARSRAASGRGLPAQAWNLVPKVTELDRLVRPELQDRLVEAHPELAFAHLAGAPALHPKRTPEGRAERQMLLARAGLGDVAQVRALGAAPDDVLDAAVLALTARRLRDGVAVRLGDGTRDARGLRMEVAY